MAESIVVKCGGSTLKELSDSFFLSMKLLKDINITPIIVHGGGPEINALLNKLEVSSEFVNGLRKTTLEVLEVAEMVLTGKVNKAIVTKLQKAGLTSIGISGCDASLLKALPINKAQLGFVGQVTDVNSEFLQQLISLNIVPVIAPIGIDDEGNHYNINADTAAGAVAESIHAKKMIFVTDVPGILKNNELQKVVTVTEINEMINDGTIYGGMIPKVKAAIKCLQGNIEEVYIINGKGGNLMAGGELVGTKIVKVKELVTAESVKS
ncbi:acetylglutamate kinase [Anaerobacillus isosaccharinicus]|uniref:Acetylglutamate kinase n=1 Tax=Anaerobacillus isosaccharinicus TaxID=1532552 RepID=A0A1S2L9E6_9BACI|nr:acetylglutamate kinase [Anaerobacillus isosaccharinicus]MBA5587697.1 acetylglutamate kinase [Anaerobacillus isosaccharinicus]QOY34134.1 acetylglutamate kinase [Anaerobacillus isosaccharinicus]